MDTWVDPAETVPEIAPMTVGERMLRIAELAYPNKSLWTAACRLTYGGYDSPLGDHTDCGGGGLCCTRGFGSLDRIEPGSLFRASNSPGTLRLASTQALIDAVTAAIPSPPLPPPVYIPPPIDCRDDILEIEMPPRKRLCLSTLGSKYEIRESSTARPTEDRRIDYGFVSTLDAEARR
nr:hypothetical protein [Tanacetum cinerariifolium]